MQKAIGYIRVSTAGQAEDGVSLEAQRAKIEAWALLNDYELVGIYEDAGISGMKSSREGLDAALKAVKRGYALVAYSLSRLTRSTKDMLSLADTLNKRGVDLVSLSEQVDTTSASGKMVFRMLAVLNEFERDQISERTKAAMQHKKSKGEYTGGKPPFGYSVVDGELVPNLEELRIIERIQVLRGDGMSYRRIADELETIGTRGRTGNPLGHVQVGRIIKSKVAA